MSHSGTSPGNSGQAGQAAAWLAQGLAALDERLLKAKSEQFTVRAAGDLAFTVQNGDGVDYAVEFKTVRTGTCTCLDFAKRGRSLGTSKHILRAVVVNWPERLDPYVELVRAHIRDAVERHANKNGVAERQPEGSEPGEKAGEAPVVAPPDALPEAQGEHQHEPGLRSSERGQAEVLAQAAAEATLDATMRLVQEAMPDIVQRVVEELFARLMERAPELFQEALRTASQAQKQDSLQEDEASS